MTDRLDIRQLRQFLAVCEAGSMTVAGERAGITTAAVSKAVALIEEDLGVALFERGPAGVRLTPAGARLRRSARELVDLHEELLGEVRAYGGRLVPRLRLYVVDSVAAFVWPRLCAELEGEVGELVLESGLVHSYAEDLLRGCFDIVIGAEPLGDMPGIEEHAILEEPLVLVCPASVPPAERDPAVLARRLPLIRFAKVRRMDALVEAYLATQAIDPASVLDCGTAALLLAMIRQGHGFALTTPLGIAFMRPNPSEIALAPLPGREIVRRITLVALEGELAGLPARLAELCRRGLREEALPLVAGLCPDIARLMRLTSRAKPIRALGSP